MKLNQLGKTTVAISLAACLQTFVTAPASSSPMYKIVWLTSNNTLVRYGYTSRRSNQTMNIKGVDGNVLGIDFRPANGMLFLTTVGALGVNLPPVAGLLTPSTNPKRKR